MYRVEVNPLNIGSVLETPFSLNPNRTGVLNDPEIWNLLEMLVDISLKNNISLFNVCNAAIQENPYIANYIPGIWEVLMERARPSSIPLRRTDFAFFFEDKKDAMFYKETYPGMEFGTLCEVAIIREDVLIECDMSWLDEINENTVSASDAISQFKHYWKSEMTLSPRVEILFSGQYKLKPIE